MTVGNHTQHLPLHLRQPQSLHSHKGITLQHAKQQPCALTAKARYEYLTASVGARARFFAERSAKNAQNFIANTLTVRE